MEMRLYNIRLLLFFLLYLFVGHTFTCHSQEETPSECRELLYLQTDKGIYETGEDLWFKAYQLDVQTFGLSDKSKTLYLQMINPKDSVVWQEKYQDGIANGIKGGIIIGENIGKY